MDYASLDQHKWLNYLPLESPGRDLTADYLLLRDDKELTNLKLKKNKLKYFFYCNTK